MAVKWPASGLRARLATATVVIAALVTAAVVVLMQVFMARTSNADSTRLVQARLDAAGSLVTVVDGRPHQVDTPDDALDRDAWIFGLDGRLIDGHVPLSLRAQVRDLVASARAGDRVVDGTRLASRPVLDHGTPVAMVVAAVDLTPYEDSERRGLVLSLILGVFAVLAAGLAASEAARFTLGRVHHMVGQAQAWEEHDLEGRFGVAGARDELAELGHTLDHMLNRIAAAIRGERRLTDEMAHELRTPLTVIRGEAELALVAGAGSSDEALHAIVDSVERAERSIAAMLDAARSRFAEAITDDVATVLRALADDRAGVTAPDRLAVGVDAGTLAAIVGPLLDNAVRHASEAVTISASEEEGHVLVLVLDDGSGVDPDDLERVFGPGVSGEGTAGLGLAVVRRLAHAVGGRVRALPGPGGRFEVRLPGG
jgi:two-component system OmpR family sensor kinase